MQRTGIVWLVIAVLLTQQACRNRQQASNQSADSTKFATTADSPTTTGVIITDRLANLGLTADSDWRGINIGDEFTKVKTTEKGESFESDARHIGYTIEFKNLESADILYYQTDQRVSAIEVDLFLNSRSSVDTYRKELESYFSGHYGTPKPDNGGLAWTSRTNKTVTLKDVSKGKDFGLKIRISSATGAVSASAK